MTHSAFQWAGQLPKIAIFPWISRPLSTTWFLGLVRVYHPIGFWIGSVVFVGLMNVTDRQTHRPRYPSAAIGRIIAIAAMRPNIGNGDNSDSNKKDKGFPYSLPSVGPGADPGVQAVSPQVTIKSISHPPGGRLPSLYARPAVTFSAAEHHRP